MKKFIVALLGLCLLSLSVAAQTAATRPRVVTAPMPQTDSPNSPAVRRPPVLLGDTKTNGQNQTTPPSKTEEPAIDDDEVIKIETNLVTFPVSVLDRQGRFISGLQKQDFQIFENGVEQKIDEFASVEKPFSVILLIDVSPSTRYQISEIQDAAVAFVDQLRRDDRVMVISFDEKVHILSPLTNNRAALRNAIYRTEIAEGTSIYDAVDNVIGQQLRRIEGRKAVVLFTDGVDTTSRRADYQSTVRETEEADALFYPIRYDTSNEMGGGYGGGGTWGNILGGILTGGSIQIGGGAAGSSPEEYEIGKRYLEELARNSGGRKFEASNDLNAAFSGIAEELRRQYSLGYYPEAVGQKGERKQIRVRVKRPNLVVRAKNSYIVGENEKNVAGR
jgi:Ca-activated chloride channel family protein